MSSDERQKSDEAVPGPAFEAVALGAFFCANPACALHVRAADPGVAGAGDWAVLADGRTFGRSRRGATVLCDACGTGRGPVKMPLDKELRDRLLAERSNRDE